LPVLSSEGHVELWPLLVLGMIQGLSEFLPISSDGHLVLTQTALALEGPHLAIDVALHLGTLCAVLLVFRRDLIAVLQRALAGERRELGLLCLGSIPAAVVGLGLRDVIEPFFSSARAAALGLFVTAGFLWVGEAVRSRRARAGIAPRPIDARAALLIGAAQALAILPGISRSGSTIATALVRGTDTAQAARFSFLLSVPAVAGAVLLEVPGLARDGGFGPELARALVVTFVVGVLALRFLLAFLARGAFRWCALYCVALGTVALAVA
jgi:undecaprenyl-diphosphatase